MNQVVRNMRQTTITSLDDSLHAGRARADELVPSRYALRIGEINVLVFSDGVLTPPATPPVRPATRTAITR